MTQSEAALAAKIRAAGFRALQLLELHAAEIAQGVNSQCSLAGQTSTVVRVTLHETTIALPIEAPPEATTQVMEQVVDQVREHCERVGYETGSCVHIHPTTFIQVTIPAGIYGRE